MKTKKQKKKEKFGIERDAAICLFDHILLRRLAPIFNWRYVYIFRYPRNIKNNPLCQFSLCVLTDDCAVVSAAAVRVTLKLKMETVQNLMNVYVIR